MKEKEITIKIFNFTGYVVFFILLLLIGAGIYYYHSHKIMEKLKHNYKLLKQKYEKNKEILKKSNKKILYLRKKIKKYDVKIKENLQKLQETENKYVELRKKYEEIRNKKVSNKEKQELFNYFSLKFYEENKHYCFETNKITLILRDCKYSKEMLQLCDNTLSKYKQQCNLLNQKNEEITKLNNALIVKINILQKQVSNLEEMLKIQKEINKQSKIKIGVRSAIIIGILSMIIILK